MSSVLDRDALEQSPLADLHLIANELGVDGFRRLRKADLDRRDHRAPVRRPTARTARGPPRTRRRSRAAARAGRTPSPTPTPRPTPRPRPTRGRGRGGRRRGRADAARRARGGAGRAAAATRRPWPRRRAGTRDRGEPRRASRAASDEDRVAEGVVELLGNGSGVHPPQRRRETTDDDVYVSAAQVKRCELVTGDRDRRPGARAAPLRALPVARARRHDQRPPGRRGRRGHASSRTCPPPGRPSASRSAPRT